MELLGVLLVSVLGACVGSFLNVVILRFGYAERGGARSACMACGTTLRPLDLIPLLSFFMLRGRCRSCGSRLLVQYPLVELSTAYLFALTFMHTSGTPGMELQFLAYAGFWTSLLGLTVYDLRHTLIPLPFVWGLYGFALLSVMSALSPMYVIGALVCGGFFALIHLVTRGRGMGIGDAYVAGAIGLLLGLEQGIVASVLAVWTGALVGLALLAIQHVFKQLALSGMRTHVTLKSEIPFAPFLAFGALLTWSMGLTLNALGLSLPFL